ncbi:excalibur calcium-binding domain-containing protein [Streptomyces niveus]|uniref:excalibur calcium-binding domain-containing protein n=1 Tax=Streptomyces niveus TaxID=193462 RepID=UPI003F4DAE22
MTATPEPAPTVTKTKTVRVTVAPAADDNGDSGDSGGSGGSDTGGSGGGSTYYANCTAVRAAGADPIRSGDPGYGSHLDRDGDGVGCE